MSCHHRQYSFPIIENHNPLGFPQQTCRYLAAWFPTQRRANSGRADRSLVRAELQLMTRMNQRASIIFPQSSSSTPSSPTLLRLEVFKEYQKRCHIPTSSSHYVFPVSGCGLRGCERDQVVILDQAMRLTNLLQ